jgi:threonine/homoserine/homoserine lactone efflux protein
MTSADMMALAGFAGVMALGQFSPGPDMLWLTRVALRDGRRAGVLTAAGIACGLAVHATLALSGLVLLLHRYDVIFVAFSVAAACYLGWLAWRICRSAPDAGGGETPGPAVRRPFWRGLACNLANPKAALFLAAVCTPFLESGRDGWFTAALWGIIVFQGGLLWSLWALLLQHPVARAAYRRHVRRIDVAFAVVLAIIAAWLVVGLV